MKIYCFKAEQVIAKIHALSKINFIRDFSLNFARFSQKVHDYCLMSCYHIIIRFAQQLTRVI